MNVCSMITLRNVNKIEYRFCRCRGNRRGGAKGGLKWLPIDLYVRACNSSFWRSFSSRLSSDFKIALNSLKLPSKSNNPPRMVSRSDPDDVLERLFVLELKVTLLTLWWTSCPFKMWNKLFLVFEHQSQKSTQNNFFDVFIFQGKSEEFNLKINLSVPETERSFFAVLIESKEFQSVCLNRAVEKGKFRFWFCVWCYEEWS